MLQVLHAKSIAEASTFSSITKPILVGGKKQMSIRSDDISCCDIDLLPSTPREIIATQCRSLFIKSHGVDGMLYRVGEHLLVGDGDNNTVIQVTEYFGVSISDQWHTFVRGNLFQRPHDEPVYAYSGSSFVASTSTVKIFSSNKILRKVMLIPDPDSSTSIVVNDFMRPNPPLMLEDIIIPIYPEEGDMVNVRGNDDDVWFAHVLSVDPSAKTCKIHFYIESLGNPGKYRRETLGRSAVEIIHWNSIITIASGKWVDGFWHILNC